MACNRKLADLAVNVVLVHEVDPPPGETPIEWLLLTSLPVDGFVQAGTVIEYYTCRWVVEVFFRVLKGGCTVEDLQDGDGGAVHELPGPVPDRGLAQCCS